MLLRFTKTIRPDGPATLLDLLAANCPVSRIKLKNCCAKGGVWLRRSGRKKKRVRRAKASLHSGDVVQICYDEAILNQIPPPPRCLTKFREYSIWIKPPMLLSQGSRYGDHCSLLRLAEKQLGEGSIHLVHRLDREASGLLLLAHSRKSAHLFSTIFRGRSVEKVYRAVVNGRVGDAGNSGFWNDPVEGKVALTEYRVTSFDADSQWTHIEVLLRTGRLHQIRRHFAGNGFPLIGDKRYGDPSGETTLHLAASRLEFTCPLTRRNLCFTLPEGDMVFPWVGDDDPLL